MFSLPGAALALALASFAGSTHLQRACVLMDTPYLPLCPAAPEGGEPQQRLALRTRLAAHPGDSAAWIHLSELESGAAHEASLRAAALLAPNEPNVLRGRAAQALAREQWPEAAALLVQLLAYHGGAEPAQVLAQLLASRDGTALLRPHLATASRWLPQVLASMPAQKLPLASALPLLAEAGARGGVDRATVTQVVRSLQAGEQWADAYALWLTQHVQPVPLLFNPGFDQPLQAGGFDWETPPGQPSRAGALVNQRRLNARGEVLEVQYTGRPLPAPAVRQYLFASPGRYQLRGEYMSTRLRLEQGLAWAVRCTHGGKALAGRTAGLQDTAGAWREFEFEFTIPPLCGAVASLQLETLAPYEAAAGFRGVVVFDNFRLQRSGA